MAHLKKFKTKLEYELEKNSVEPPYIIYKEYDNSLLIKKT